MPSTALDPLSNDAISALVASLGLSTVAGLRAAAVLFAVGLAYDIHGPNGQPLLPLHGAFQVLGSPWVLAILAVLAIAEFLADKFPGLDHINDIIATVIRPVVGATILAGTANTLSDQNIWVAAIVGALLALTTHGVKAGTRAVSTATTAGVANPLLSVGEDILTVGSVVLLILAPFAGIVLALILVLLAWRVFAWFGGRRKRSRQAKQASGLSGQRSFHTAVESQGLTVDATGRVASADAAPLPGQFD